LVQNSQGVDPLTAYMVRTLKADGSANLLGSTSHLGLSATGLGDVNGDGYADFALSAHGETVPSVIVVFGASDFHTKLFQGGMNSDPTPKFGGDPMYERWAKLRVRTLDPASSLGCSNVSNEICALQIKSPGDSGDYFGVSVMAGGDINSDGQADLLISDPNFDSPYGVTGVGRSLTFFGDSFSFSSLHYKSVPTTKARCRGSDMSRQCQPLSYIPKYADNIVSGLVNNTVSNNQKWRARSDMIIRSTGNLSTGQKKYSYPNFGSRAGNNTVDKNSSDFLICNLTNFSHQDNASFRDLGACGVYY
jgi:hypothetical protein